MLFRTLTRLWALVLLLTILSLQASAEIHATPDRGRLMEMQTPAPSGTIVIKFSDASGMAMGTAGLLGDRDTEVARVTGLLERLLPQGRLERRFSRPAADLDAERVAAEMVYGGSLPDLNRYAQLIDPSTIVDRAELMTILREILADPAVEHAWLEPVAVPAALGFDAFTGAVPDLPEAMAGGDRSPDFTGYQGYLNDAPEGVGAWSVDGIPGARGATVQVVDVEGAWLWTHEDLPAPFFEAGGQFDNESWRNHGTAVMGEIRGGDNTYGVRGIIPDCAVGCSSIAEQSTADAINNAAANIEAGDIILIELHAPGPNADGSGQFGYVCMEYWQDNFDAMLLAALAGRIVCEAAGNGYQNLDDPVYEGLFDRNVRDSGAIMCGASNGSSLEPAGFSNHGSRLDLHGWGYNVTTCGYGWLHGGAEEEWYTDGFSGTSSASPIVVGAVGSLQGMVKSAFGFPLDARLARQILRETGTPQEGSSLIGPRPNLPAAWVVASAGVGRVVGVVTDSDSGDPVAGVRIDVTQSGTFAITAADGSYSFPLTAGNYDVDFSEFFYQPTTAPVTVTGTSVSTLNVAMTPLPTISFDGIVFDEERLPLAGVDVTPLDIPLPPTITDNDGLFEIAGVPEDMSSAMLFDGLPGHGAVLAIFNAAVPPGTWSWTYGYSGTIVLPTMLEDFETGDGGFTSTDLWSWDEPDGVGPDGGFSGTHCWGVGMDGHYPDNASGTLTSPEYYFTGVPHLRLSFHIWSATEGAFDGVNLEVNGGSGWELISPLTKYTDVSLGGLGGAPGWSGFTYSWRGVVFDLHTLIGSDFRFRLNFGSDGGATAPGFWIDGITFDTGDALTATGHVKAPGTLSLNAWPNPFNPATEIQFELPAAAVVSLKIFDLQGRVIRTLVDAESRGFGSHTAVWHGRDSAGRPVASGLYLYRLESGGRMVTRKMTLLK
jgi:hypothetical protein